MKRSSCSLILLSALVLVHPAQAEIYKWVDGGETHYSEHKPAEGVAVETITPWTSAPTAERATLEARIEASDKRREERAVQDKKDSEEKAYTDKVQHNCEQANLRVASLERPRINKVNADGTLSRMPEEWRRAQLDEARAAVEKYCK
jgi:hypothetical protein